MTGRVWAGVDIGGTKTAVVLSVDPPAILCRQEFPTLPAEGPNGGFFRNRKPIPW